MGLTMDALKKIYAEKPAGVPDDLWDRAVKNDAIAAGAFPGRIDQPYEPSLAERQSNAAQYAGFERRANSGCASDAGCAIPARTNDPMPPTPQSDVMSALARLESKIERLSLAVVGLGNALQCVMIARDPNSHPGNAIPQSCSGTPLGRHIDGLTDSVSEIFDLIARINGSLGL